MALSQNFFSYEFCSIAKLMAYISIENEADPSYIIENCIRKNVEVFVPGLDLEDKIHPMKFCDTKRLVMGKYNVPEPSERAFYDSVEIDLILVPGVAFDLKGNRIGYGKGCYDSFLKDTKAIKVGVCYEFQLISGGIKADIYDIHMDYIMTENKIYEVNNAL